MAAHSAFRPAALAAAILIAGCFGDSTAPRRPAGGGGGAAGIALAPVFSTAAAGLVAFDHVRIVLSRTSGVALDTTVAFPANADSISLELRVTLNGAQESFTATMAFSAGLDTVFRGGPVTITASAGILTTTASVPVRYTGIGSNAKSVAIATRTASVFFRDSVTLTAAALDSAGKPIPGTPIRWTSLDTTLAQVRFDSSGRVIGGATRGSARIQALLLTGPADTAHVTVQPLPAALGVVSGNGQVGVVAATLPLPLVVQVKGSDSLGVRGIAVRFAAAAGAGSLTDTLVATDSLGLARTTWTLGTVAHADSVQASVVGRPIAPVTFTSAAAAGAATTLVFSTQPPASAVYQAPFNVAVTAKDSLGNVATSFTGAVTVAIATNPATGTLSGALTQPASAGVATFTGLSVDNIGTGYTLSASATGPTAATSNAFGIVAPPGWNAWINTAGGNWSLASNWSSGAVPVATDSVAIKQSGTYTVTLDVSAAPATLQVGAPHGAQTLALPTSALTVGTGAFGPNTALALSGLPTGGPAGTLGVRSGGALAVAGAFNVSGGTLADTGQLTVTGVTTWSGGSLNVFGPPLTLSGGSGASFGGTANVGSAGALILGGGTFTLSGNLNVAGGGGVIVSSGGLVLNGHTTNLAGGFSTGGGGTGTLTMANPLDSLLVTGSANFGGGAGTLSSGTIVVGGNFTQTGTGPVFAPSGTQLTLLSGATPTVSFADPVGSFFNRLTVAGAATLKSNVLVQDTLHILTSASLVGASPFRLRTNGYVEGAVSSTFAPFVWEVAGMASVDTGTVNPDTTVFLTAGQVITSGPGNYTWNSIRIAADTVLASFGFTTGRGGKGGDLVIGGLAGTSGTLALNGANAPVFVSGSLVTQGLGKLKSHVPGSTVTVTGNVTFGGGSTAGLDTTGVLALNGNFTQTGPGAVFAPSGTHRVRFTNAVSAVQTIQFADTGNSFFNDLELNQAKPDTVRMLSNVQVQDSAIVAGSSVLASTSLEALKTPATGTVRVHSGGVLRPSRVEIGEWNSLSADSVFLGGPIRIMADTAVFLGVNDTIGSGSYCPVCGWKSVRASGDTLVSVNTVFNGNLIISAGVYVDELLTSADTVNGFLRTEGTGALLQRAVDGTQTMVVRDSAVFAGGDESGRLASFAFNALRIGGDFVQRIGSGGVTTTFVATGNHHTIFSSGGPHAVTFASPGSTQSTFAGLVIEANPSLANGITLGSDIYLSGNLEDTSRAATDSIAGNGHTVYADSLNLGSQFVMNNAQLVTNSTGMIFSGLTFRNMSPTVTQWTMNQPPLATGAISVSGLTFATAPTTGRYFDALMSAGGTNTMTVTGGSPAASLLTGFYSNQNANGIVAITWNSTTLPNVLFP